MSTESAMPSTYLGHIFLVPSQANGGQYIPGAWLSYAE